MKRTVMAMAVAFSLPASASVIYDWTGQCTSNCDGPTSVGVLAMDDSYEPGTAVSCPIQGPCNIVSWTYNGSTFRTHTTYPDGTFFSIEAFGGGFLPAVSGPGDFAFASNSFADFPYSFNADGSWRLHRVGFSDYDHSHIAQGFGSTFTLRDVPVPNTALLLLSGMGVLWFCLRLRG